MVGLFDYTHNVEKMNRIMISLAFCFVFLSCSGGSAAPEKPDAEQDKSEVNIQTVPLADPHILLHEGTYYAYGTHSDDGIEVYTSDNLKQWKYGGLALHRKDSWGEKWFWAPEVYELNGRFYMFYSAEEHVCMAVGDSPLGPFKQEKKEPMIGWEKCIDNTLFIDDDGSKYMFFDRFNDGLNIWSVKLNDDMSIDKNTLRPCIHVSQKWEEVWPRVNEGAFVWKHDGQYYLLYSANSYESQMYGVGFAVTDRIGGEWVKYEKNPVLQCPKDLVGVGHGALFTDKEGKLRYVFHAHHSKRDIHPRDMYITTVSFDKDGNMQMSDDYIVPELITDSHH